MNRLSIIIKATFLILITILSGCNTIDIAQVKKEIVEKRSQLTAQQQIAVDIELLELKDESSDGLKMTIEMYNRSIREHHPEYSLDKEEEQNIKNFKLEDERYVEKTYKTERSDYEILSEYLYYLQSGLFFYQQYDKELLNLNVIHYNGINRRGIPADIPEPIALLGSSPSIVLTKLHYNDTKEDVNIAFPELNREVVNIDKNALIDSLTINYSIPFISEKDSVVISPSDVGKTIKGFEILKFADNYIYYIESEKRVLETKAYSASGQLLTSLYYQPGFDYYLKNSLDSRDNLKAIASALEGAKSDSVARYLTENYLVTRKLNYSNYIERINFCTGNIAKYVIVFEKERDFKILEVTYPNLNNTQQVFIKQLRNETAFVDHEGTTLFKSPLLDLEYAGNEGGIRCANYIKYEKEDSYEYTYYYIDVANKKLVELKNAESMQVLNDNLVAMEIARDAEFTATGTIEDDMIHSTSAGRNIILFNSENEQVSDDIFSYIENSNGVIVAGRGDDHTVLDASGKRIGEQGLRSIDDFHYGIAAVSAPWSGYNFDFPNGTYFRVGFINAKGEYIVPLEYDDYESLPHCEYRSGYLMVGKDGLLGIVNLKDKAQLVVPCIYKKMYITDDSKELLYIVNIDGDSEHYGVINEKGETIIPSNYSEYDMRDELKKRGLYYEE